MWKRDSYHNCAEELNNLSLKFRKIFLDDSVNESEKNRKLQNISKEGMNILKILALSIRPEMDYNLIPSNENQVGIINESASTIEVSNVLNNYNPSLRKNENFDKLKLRESLNKIAHPDISRTSFYADKDIHELIICGEYNKKNWIAIISLEEFCRVVKSLPDKKIKHNV